MIMITMMTVTMMVMMAVIMITIKKKKNNRKNTLDCVRGSTNNKNKGSEVFATKFC